MTMPIADIFMPLLIVRGIAIFGLDPLNRRLAQLMGDGPTSAGAEAGPGR